MNPSHFTLHSNHTSSTFTPQPARRFAQEIKSPTGQLQLKAEFPTLVGAKKVRVCMDGNKLTELGNAMKIETRLPTQFDSWVIDLKPNVKAGSIFLFDSGNYQVISLYG
jgi:hypothetical protein